MELATSNYLQSIPAIVRVTFPDFRDSTINKHHPNKSLLCTSIHSLICIDDGSFELNSQVLQIIILRIFYHVIMHGVVSSFHFTQLLPEIISVCLLCLSVASSWQLSSLSTSQIPVSSVSAHPPLSPLSGRQSRCPHLSSPLH